MIITVKWIIETYSEIPAGQTFLLIKLESCQARVYLAKAISA